MRRFLSLFTMLMLFGVFAFAQNRVVSGKVTDKDGNPVPFASVKIKNGKTGVQADAYGAYSIKVKDGDVLLVSATSFKEVEVPVGTQTYLNSTLERTGNLTEVVVTSAFGTKRSLRTVSSNAQVVGGEQLNTIRSTNLNNALAGKVSGIQVRSQSAAALGRAGNVRLRGESEFGGGANVTYVVDGTILPNANDINLDDIEDVTVLQGPNATALFGPDAANGAIVITTKRAKKGAKGMGLEVNTGVTFDKVYILPNYQNSYGGGASYDMYKYTWKPGQPDAWKALDGKYYPDYSDDASWGPRMVGQEYIPWYAWYGGHERSYKTASFTPQPNNARDYYNTGVTLNNNVAFSKATDNMNLRVSYGNIDVKGMIATTYLKKNTLNVNSGFDLSNKLTLGFNVNYVNTITSGEFDDNYSNQTSGSFNQWFHRDLDMNIERELKDLRTPDGIHASWNHNNPDSYDPANPKNFYAGNYWYNHFTWFDLVKPLSRADRLFGDASITYKFNNDLRIRGTYRKQQNTTYSEQKFSTDLIESGTQTTGNCPECKGYYGTSNTFANRDNFELLASYNHKVHDFNISGNAGVDLLHVATRNNSANTNNGLVVPNFYSIGNSKDQPSVNNFRQEEKRRAAFVTATLVFRNYLSVDATARKDFYSGNPPAKAGVFTKSIGAAFVFSDLIKDQAPFLSYGKIRASAGETPSGVGPYLYPGFLYGVGQFQWNGNILMSTPDQIVDPSLTGAVKQQKEIGAELRFLKNRVGITGTYYKGVAKNFVTTTPLNSTSGFSSLLTNGGEIDKKGVDIQLMLRPIWTENFKWEINGTWGRLISNKVISISKNPDPNSPAQTIVEGQWGVIGPYLVHAEGQEWGQIYGNGIKRINGQPVLDANGFYVNDSKVYFGNVLPKYTGGVQSRFDILKNFTINVNIDYQMGGKFFSLSDMWGSYSGLTARTAELNDKGNSIRDPVADGGGKHVYGVDATGKPVDFYVNAQDYYHKNYDNRTFDEYIYDLTFVKLRELSLGYNIPLNRAGLGKWLTKASFSVVARNPVLIYAKTKDFDPSEISNLSGEQGNFPGSRGVGVNLKLGF